MTTYKALLDICDQHNIDRYDVNIANEVEFFFIDEGGRYRADFEQLCDLVSKAYLHVDCYVSLSTVVESLHHLVTKEHKDVNSISKQEIVANIANLREG